MRDELGSGAGFLTNPLSAIPGGAISERGSLDYYATLRSIDAQRRAAMAEEGREESETAAEIKAADKAASR